MKKPRRWLAPWKDSTKKPAIYHCLNRVVDRRFVLHADEKEKFRSLLQRYEAFSGCRVLAHCLMSNHFHILLEVPPRPAGGLSDETLLRRLRALYSERRVNEIAEELAACRERNDEAGDREARRIHESFSYRMHDLSEFMKGLTQRFTRWFNRTHDRTGRLWEERFRSVIVESGTAARTMAAYIDLNPVRAGIAGDPADYRWSSYGEAAGAGDRRRARRSREGLARVMRPEETTAADGGIGTGLWRAVAGEYRELMDRALERKPGNAGTPARESPMAEMLRHRVRYFTDGVVIGSRGFVDEVFRETRERFGPKRKDGARKMRGTGAPAAGTLWSLRNLRTDIG